MPPAVPEVRLHLAPEPLAPWLATEVASQHIEPPPFWAHAWPGGLALARFVLDEVALVRGKRVLDFASGCGVSAIACAKAGAASVLATEIDPWAIEAIGLNAELNDVHLETSARDVIGQADQFDVVLVGDVFYERELSARLIAWLSRLEQSAIFVGDPGRSFMPVDHLESVKTFTFPPTPAWDSVIDRPARVWRWKSERR